ncbi:MAG TPA: NAD-dependent epimerase/dehydratase family protein [Roseiarcus sp.]|nr:NAD-dependent epimerase/dehydratase family protein [Roseiarcus sp.]
MTRVLVTGATGFLASHAIADLLAQGYVVRGTVRSTAKALKEAALARIPGAERLELIEADLLDAASFERPAQGCDAVLHMASPYAIQVENPQRDLVDPAVQGTKAVLAAAAKAGVRRVVLTSSMAAITDEPPADHALSEADWNAKSSLTRNPYHFSKTQAERAAWRFMDEAKPGFDLVVVNPSVVIGPSYTKALNESHKLLVGMTKGVYPGVLALNWGFVDVRDVARAHVLALETPSAQGRYLCAGDILTMRETVAALREALPQAKLPSLPLDNFAGTTMVKLGSYMQPAGVGSFLRSHIGRKLRYDNAKIRRDLGLSFRPARAAIAEAAADLVKWRHIRV